MARRRRPVEKEEMISVAAAGEILRAAEGIRKFAFMSGIKEFCESNEIERNQDYPEELEVLYKEWKKKLLDGDGYDPT